jgi:hypothetical protein
MDAEARQNYLRNLNEPPHLKLRVPAAPRAIASAKRATPSTRARRLARKKRSTGARRKKK